MQTVKKRKIQYLGLVLGYFLFLHFTIQEKIQGRRAAISWTTTQYLNDRHKEVDWIFINGNEIEVS